MVRMLIFSAIVAIGSASMYVSLAFPSALFVHAYTYIPTTFLNALSYDTLQTLTREIALHKSPEAALSFIDMTLDDTTPITEATLHALTHAVGHVLNETQGLNGLATCAKERVGISMGCYHGIMEHFFRDQADIRAVDISVFTDVCGTDVHSLDCFDIYHGLGHGFLQHFSLQRDEAIKMCHRFNDQLHVAHCLKGVAMQWAEAAPFEELEAAEKDPWALCEGDALWEDACATILEPRLSAYLENGAQTLDLDLYAVSDAVVEDCAIAPNNALRAACFRGLGIMATIRATDRPAADVCEKAVNLDARECLRAIASRAHELNDVDLVKEHTIACARLTAYGDTCPTNLWQ